jgi:hypothetical protein
VDASQKHSAGRCSLTGAGGAGFGKQKCLFSQGKIGYPQCLHPDQQILQKRCLSAWSVTAEKGLPAELEEGRQLRGSEEVIGDQ